MKNRYFFIFAFLLVVSSFLNGQAWRKTAAESQPSFLSSYFINANAGWYVGNDGVILKTTDGGKTCSAAALATTDHLKSVFFLDANNGFVGAAGNKIYKTADGGNTWTAVTLADGVTGTAYIYSIYFADAQKGWALSSSSSAGKVLKTVDGGNTWTVDVDNPAGDLEKMYFFNGTTGIVVGGGTGKLDIYFTKDGATWTKATAPTLPAGYTRTDIKTVFMIDQNTALASGWGSLVGAQATIHLKTTDGGATWEYLTQQNKTYDNIVDLYFKDANNGLAIGGGTKTSVLLKTSDGGVNWVPTKIPCGSSLTAINGFGDEVIVTTNAGTVLKSANFGASWELLTSVPSTTISTISALNDNTIIAGGNDGIIIKSTNAGKDWQGCYQSADGYSINIQSIYFVNENVGYTANSYGMAAKTTDGGKTWARVINDTTDAAFVNYSVYFVNENLGFVVGKAGSNVDVIYKTTDGGTTWDVKQKIVSANLRSVAFADAQVGAAVGEKLKAVYTKDGGSTWQAAVFNNVPSGSSSAALRDVVFVDASNAIAVGDKIILKSSDAGATWEYVSLSDLNQTLTAAAVKNNKCWAVGNKTSSPKSVALYQSLDNGTTWANQVDYSIFDSTKAVNDVCITPNGSVFAGGAVSTIYTNAIPVSVEEENESLPSSFSLMQNYPNPFNPETTIKYSVSQSSFVTLKIYDVLGKEIASLVNVFMQPGQYSAKLSANNLQLSSGIYFYRLTAGSYQSIKKMILVK